jgi:hypothetical protein
MSGAPFASARRLAQSAATHVAHHRVARGQAECPHHVKARDPGDGGDVGERDLLGEMAFDEPQRLDHWVHYAPRIKHPSSW